MAFFQNGEAKQGGHNRKDYYLTLDTAKEISMVERNDQGRMARRYFIECEKKLREKHNRVMTLSAPTKEFVKQFFDIIE